MITATTAPKHWYEIDPTKYNKIFSVRITTDVVSLNLDQGEVYNIM
jgi:hypothetical protein